MIKALKGRSILRLLYRESETGIEISDIGTRMRITPLSLHLNIFLSRAARAAYVIMLETAEGAAKLGGTTVISS